MVSLWETSRGTRRMREWVDFLDLCRDMGVLIRVFDEDDPATYDPRRTRDRETLLREGIKAESEVDRLRGRTVSGSIDAASQGRPGGHVPDGYKRVYGGPAGDSPSDSGHRRRREISQVVDEERAAIYRAAAEGLLNGVPAMKIAKILTAFGVPTAAGHTKWRGTAIWTSLLKPSMEGHRERSGVIVARNAWPPIIDSVTAARLRQMRYGSHAARSVSDTRLKYPLSGAMRCGVCRKQSMSGGPDRWGLRYRCSPLRQGCGNVSGQMAGIEGTVQAMVVERLRKPDAWAIFQPASVDDGKLVMAQSELDALTLRRDELYTEAAKPGGPSMALVAAAERLLLPEIEAASLRLTELRKPAVLRDYDPVDLADHWPSYSPGEQRVVILALADVVLSPTGKGGWRWSPWRLSESRWQGDSRTWGDLWREQGLAVGA